MLKIKEGKKAAVLAALYNHSKPQGMGHLHYDAEPMSEDDAQRLLEDFGDQESARIYFDYLKGRVMKVNLTDEVFNPAPYDRDNGPGAALLACGDLVEESK